MAQIAPPREPDVIRVLREHRQAIDAHEAETMRRMAAEWLTIEQRLDADMFALAVRMQELAEEGKPITEQMVWRQERYQIIKAQLQEQVTRYNGEAVKIISDAQAVNAQLGISAANEAISASYAQVGAVGPYWNRLNLGAVESMIGLAGDGSPLKALLVNAYPDAADGMMKALINGIGRGLGPYQVAREMADGLGMGLDRAILIARTETARVYRDATTQQYRASGVVNGFYRLVKKETACAACLMLDGQFFTIEEELSDHPAGKAELPGNLIESSTPDAFITLRHDGDIVIIRTASGKFLPVTPNHPVLTRRGWVAAAFVKKGDDVISGSFRDGASSVVCPNKNHVPTPVENIPSAFNMVRLGSVPEAAQNLYSNREDGKVNVVFINRLLWDSIDSASREKIKQDLFIGRHTRSIGLSRLGDLTSLFVRRMGAAVRFLSLENSSLALRFCHSAPSEVGGLRACSSFYSLFGEYTGNYIPGNTIKFRDRQLGNSNIIKGGNSITGNAVLDRGVDGTFHALNLCSFGFTPEQPMSLEKIREGLFRSMPPLRGNLDAITRDVVFDRVVDIDIQSFSGHVYSLQTQEGWYYSNNIISHNCISVPAVEGMTRPRWQTGKEWFLELPEDQQLSRLGPARYELWQDGKMELDDLAKLRHSDTWGDSPAVATIKELTEGE